MLVNILSSGRKISFKKDYFYFIRLRLNRYCLLEPKWVKEIKKNLILW
jgi:hypothetical protein